MYPVWTRDEPAYRQAGTDKRRFFFFIETLYLRLPAEGGSEPFRLSRIAPEDFFN